MGNGIVKIKRTGQELNDIAVDKDTIADLKAMVKLPKKVFVTGYHNKNDGAFGSHFFKLRAGVVPDGSFDNGGTVIETVNGVYDLQFEGAVNVKWFGVVFNTDMTTEFQNSVDFCKSSGKKLIVPRGKNDVDYCMIDNIDISTIEIEAEVGVIFKPTLLSNNSPLFTTSGTAVNRITKPTTIRNITHDSQGTQNTLLSAYYSDNVTVVNCKGGGYPDDQVNDGKGLFFVACKNPVVKNSNITQGRYGVLFVSCENPLAKDVIISESSRDGILFYSDKTIGMTINAKANRCVVDNFNIDGEIGRGGIHFYGSLGASANGCKVGNDNYTTTSVGAGAIRFRDCTNFSVTNYEVYSSLSGIEVVHIDDYSDHAIIKTAGIIGIGTASENMSYGIFVLATSKIDCNIVGANVIKTVGIEAFSSGIYHGAIGAITGCTLDDMETRGISATGDVIINSCYFQDTGKGVFNNFPIYVDGKAEVNNCRFKNITDTREQFIRIANGGEAIVGINSYDIIATNILISDGGLLLKGSSPINVKFTGAPTETGVENSQIAIDASGNRYVYDNSAWVQLTAG